MRYCFSTLFLLFTTISFAQNSDSIKFQPRGYVALGAGVGIPIGDYASSTSFSYGDYAHIGRQLNFSGGIPLKKSHYGIAFMYLNFRNPKVSNNYTTADYYTGKVIMAGLLYTIAKKNISYDFRLLGGWGWSSFPNFGYSYPDPKNYPYGYYDVNINSSSGNEVAIDFGAQIRIPIIEEKLICLTIGVDFYYANPKYSSTETVSNFPYGNYSTTFSIDSNIPTLFVSFTAGIAFQISGHYLTPVNQHGHFE